MLKNFASHVLRISIVNSKGNPIADDAEYSEKYRKVVCTTQRNGNVVKKVILKLVEDPLMFEVLDKSNSGTENTVYLSLKTHGPSNYHMVAAHTGLKETTIRNAMTVLKKFGKIKIHHKDGTKVFMEAV